MNDHLPVAPIGRTHSRAVKRSLHNLASARRRPSRSSWKRASALRTQRY